MVNNACTVRFDVRDESSSPLHCRIHVYDAAGKPQRATNLPFWNDHFVCPGTAQLDLSVGDYTFEVERGPEYLPRKGSFRAAAEKPVNISLQLKRMGDLSSKGWWSGELHVHRPPEDIELLMKAEDLHVAPVITWWNNRNLWEGRDLPENPLLKFENNQFADIMAGEDEREGGALLFFHLKRPLPITGAGREFPSPMQFVDLARRERGVWIDIEKPFWWDVPIWLASGKTDSIGIANNHMCRSRMYEDEAWGRPRDVSRLPAPRGNGFWTQEIYYHALNCGLRIPPSAGSASGVLPNPVGYNRVYVHLDGGFDYGRWWEGLREGRSFVTNGPLLLCRAEGKPPGHIFTAQEGKALSLSIECSLISNEPLTVEVVRNGSVMNSFGIEKTAFARGVFNGTIQFDPITFDESGWFLVRAITRNEKTFRFASTAPYYVEIGESKRRISAKSARFFLDWVDERAKRVKVEDNDQLTDVMRYHRIARTFWVGRLAAANREE